MKPAFRTLVAASMIAATIAAPAFADGRKGPPAFVAQPVPELQVEQPPEVPEETPPPVYLPPGPTPISLSSGFGTGGVGANVSGGYFGGGGRVIYANSVAGGQAVAIAFAFASASSQAYGGFRGGHRGGGGGCGCN